MLFAHKGAFTRMRILFGRRSELLRTTDERLREYLEDRLLGVNTLDIGVIEIENPPKVVTIDKIVRRPYVKSLKTERPSWVKALVFWGGVSIIGPNVDQIPALIKDANNLVSVGTINPERVDLIEEQIEVPFLRQEERVVTDQVEVQEVVGSTSFNESGQVIPDPQVVNSIVDELQAIVAQGGRIDQLEIRGTASDEWGSLLTSLGQSDQGNVDTALRRAQNFAEAVMAAANERGFSVGDIQITSFESELDDTDIAAIELMAQQFGYQSVDQMFDLYKSDRSAVPPSVSEWFDIRLGSQRGSIISAEVTTIDAVEKTIIVSVPDTRTETKITEVRTPIENPKDFEIFPMFIPPIGIRYRDKTQTILQRDIEKIPVTDEALLKLYPEAKSISGTLENDSWRWTRKYQFLMRDDRIDYMHRFDYIDAKGQPQTLRVAFIDHVPSDHVLKAVEQMLVEAASVADGQIAEKLSLIAIYPEGDAYSRDPEVLGLGIDTKEGPGVGGLAIPALGLVEIQMNPASTEAELDAHFGLKHVFRHEVLGHFTDLGSEKPKLRKVEGIHNGYHLRTPWKTTMIEQWLELRDLHFAGVGPRWNFTQIKDGVQPGILHSPDGELYHRSTNKGEVPNSRDVIEVEQVNAITPYGLTDPRELWAETVAHGYADVPLEAKHTLHGKHLPVEVMNRIGGVRPAREIMEFVHSELGTMVQRDGAFFPSAQRVQESSTTTSGVVEVDPEFAEIVADAKTRPLPLEPDLISVVTTVRSVGSESKVTEIPQDPAASSSKTSNMPSSRSRTQATKASPSQNPPLSL